MKKVTILLGLGLVAAAGFLVIRSRWQAESWPSSNDLAVAPQSTSTASEAVGGVVESTATPQAEELPKVQETLPAPENPQIPTASPPPSSALLDQELPVVVPAPLPVRDFLLAVKTLTDSVQMSQAEVNALGQYYSAGETIPEATLVSMEAKASRGKDESVKLADLEDTVQIKDLMLLFYSQQLGFYQAYRDQGGADDPQNLKELYSQWLDSGVRCDNLRLSLHSKYGLGEL